LSMWNTILNYVCLRCESISRWINYRVVHWDKMWRPGRNHIYGLGPFVPRNKVVSKFMEVNNNVITRAEDVRYALPHRVRFGTQDTLPLDPIILHRPFLITPIPLTQHFHTLPFDSMSQGVWEDKP
jgi:hypothetical protein